MPIVDRRLFLTADKSRLVEPDDPEAAFLWAGEGAEVSDEEAEQVGYKATKKKAAPDNKAVEEPDADKAKPVKKAAKRKSG